MNMNDSMIKLMHITTCVFSISNRIYGIMVYYYVDLRGWKTGFRFVKCPLIMRYLGMNCSKNAYKRRKFHNYVTH